jgi:hypothetical protein
MARHLTNVHCIATVRGLARQCPTTRHWATRIRRRRFVSDTCLLAIVFRSRNRIFWQYLPPIGGVHKRSINVRERTDHAPTRVQHAVA